MTIIGFLAALVGPKLWGKISAGKQVAAKAQIEHFGTALDAFPLDIGRYPTTEEGLKALREKPSSADNLNGPYLPKEIPLDPWRKPYIYKFPVTMATMTLFPTGPISSKEATARLRMWSAGRISSSERKRFVVTRHCRCPLMGRPNSK